MHHLVLNKVGFTFIFKKFLSRPNLLKQYSSGYTPNQFNLNRLSPQQQQQLQQQQQMNSTGSFGNQQQNQNQFGNQQGVRSPGGAQVSPLTRQFSSPAGTPTGPQQPPSQQWNQNTTRMAANPLLTNQLSVSFFNLSKFKLLVKFLNNQ